MKLALDTNVLAYAEGVNGASRQETAAALVACLPLADTMIPVQVLGELFRVLTAKAGRSTADARAAVIGWQDGFATLDTSRAALLAAMDLATDHKLSVWDAIIMAVAAEAGCRLLLSEDMQPGFTWRGLTVVDPFATAVDSLLETALQRPSPSPY